MKDNQQAESINKEQQLVQKRLKVIVLGEAGVGKRSLVNLYCQKKTNDTQYLTISYQCKKILVDDKETTLYIYTPNGLEKYGSLGIDFFKKTDVVIYMFDLGAMESFTKLVFWIQQVQTNCQQDGLTSILVGNKSSAVQQVVPHLDIKQFSKDYNLRYLEISTQDKVKIGSPFYEIVKMSLLSKPEKFKTIFHDKNQKKSSSISFLQLLKRAFIHSLIIILMIVLYNIYKNYKAKLLGHY